MDMKRYEEIDGLDALKRFSREEDVYNEIGYKLYIDDCKLWMGLDAVTGVVDLTITNILEGKWYVKKPFDVRAEMLSRPNEWVGAFKNKANVWIKVGFDSKCMGAILTICSEDIIKPDCESDFCNVAHHSVLDICIPIEDVPKEELA